MTIQAPDLDVAVVVSAAIAEHGGGRDALIPILGAVNSAFGHISEQALKEIKRQLNAADHEMLVTEGQLFSIASFYHMFSTKPLGKHVVRFCESAPCHVVGGRQLLQAVMDHLELKPGETSLDRQWSLVTTSCLGVCGVGPVMLVDDDIFGNVRPEQVSEILGRYL
jgi:NADH-quinone oxidoreductase subunit E